ncbi:MAG: NAD(P)H-hydrate epimerase [Pirellulaceae bacterium]
MPAVHLSRAWARKIDERAMDEFAMPGILLMENAGRGSVDVLEKLGVTGVVAVCCGKGNNAGDGLVMARHLELRGHRVRVLLWCDPARLRGDAALNYEIAARAELPLVICPDRSDRKWLQGELAGADWIVDALLGTGAEGPPRPPLDQVISVLNELPARKLAVDLPSGLDCDTGLPASPTFRADHTVTFVAPKAGFRNPQARPYLGEVHVVDIGAPRLLVDQILVRAADGRAG